MGPAVFTAGETSISISSLPRSTSGFNGARGFHRGRARRRVDRRPRLAGFNGARGFHRGRARRARRRCCASRVLQWGPRFSPRERPRLGCGARASRGPLQWGPRFSPRESAPGSAYPSGSRSASMGPAVFTAGECSARRSGARTARALQWGPRFSPRERHLKRASMPRADRRFNGARGFHRGRADLWGDAAELQAAVLQWGPRFSPRERCRGRRSRRRPPKRFNGARGFHRGRAPEELFGPVSLSGRFNGARGFHRGRVAASARRLQHRRASMGPAVLTAGEAIRRPIASISGVWLQWGPRFSPRESRRRARWRGGSRRCFNGARGFHRGRGRDAGRFAHREAASMGPAVFTAGESPSDALLPKYVTLQWGPRFSPRESAASGVPLRAAAGLQWGPRFSPRESGTRPRPPRCSRRSFNGARGFHRGRGRPHPRAPGRAGCFNGARGFHRGRALFGG